MCAILLRAETVQVERIFEVCAVLCFLGGVMGHWRSAHLLAADKILGGGGGARNNDREEE